MASPNPLQAGSRAPKDFGAGSWRPGIISSPFFLAALVIATGAAVAIWNRMDEEPHDIARARAWAVAGAPCPVVDARAFTASPVKAHISTQYGDLGFDRAYGHVYCDEIHDDGGRGLFSHPVCQFTSPAVLKVTTPKGEFYFVPSSGPATVAVIHDVPICVRGGWFNGSMSQW